MGWVRSGASRRGLVLLIGLVTLAVMATVASPGMAASPEVSSEVGGEFVPDGRGELAATFDAAADHSPHGLVVKLRPGVDPEDVFAEPFRWIVGRWWQVETDVTGAARAVASSLAGRRGVELVDLDYRLPPIETPLPSEQPSLEPAAATPNDEFYWAQWNVPMIQTLAAWDRADGSGVTVAVIDSGVIPTSVSEDLKCHDYVMEYNSANDSQGAGVANDTDGHGTHVAGTISQCTNNGLGMAGVAPGARLMPIRATDGAGEYDIAGVARALRWAADHGAGVINLSIGTTGDCDAPCSYPVIVDAIAYVKARDVVMVAAAGNESEPNLNTTFPANHPDVIAVGAVDLNAQLAPYSNSGDGIDLVAPGGNQAVDLNSDGVGDGIYQETITAACPPFSRTPTDYCGFNGTSMASPHVAAAAAILRSHRPNASAGQIRTALRASALDLGSPGYDTTYGHGLLQVNAALTYLETAPNDTNAPIWTDDSTVDVDSILETGARATWSDSAHDAGGVDGYRIYARANGSPHDKTGGDLVAEVDAPQTVATLSGLAPSTEYFIWVEAVDSTGRESSNGPVTTFTTAIDFNDTEGDVFERDIEWLSGADVTRGCNPPDNDLFCPDDPVTRGQMAAFLVRALDLRTTGTDFFGDDDRSVFEADINRLANADVTRGCNPPTNDEFCPDEPVTRGQMASFLARALDLPAEGPFDLFGDDNSSVHESDINRLAEAEITRGCNPPDNDRFCPDDPVTRGQMAAFLRRALSG